MPLQGEGPCASPGCKDRHNSAGQWTRIPREFVGDLYDGHLGYLCKRDPCREYFGLPPLNPAGKKRVAAASAATGSAIGQDLALPHSLRRIDQVWGVRCAARAHALPRPPPELCSPRARFCVCGAPGPVIYNPAVVNKIK